MNTISISCPGESESSCVLYEGKSKLFDGSRQAKIIINNYFDSECQLSTEFTSFEELKLDRSKYSLKTNTKEKGDLFQVHDLGNILAKSEKEFSLEVVRKESSSEFEDISLSSKITINCGGNIKEVVSMESKERSERIEGKFEVKGVNSEIIDTKQKKVSINNSSDSSIKWLCIIFCILLIFLIWASLFYLLKRKYIHK